MNFELHLGDCVNVMREMNDNSVDLILTDPPYFKVKDEPWDNQWAKPQQFLAWLDQVLAEFQRILKPNGSLYLFASPQMAARVEVLMGQRFDVLNSIRWHKASGWHKKARKEDLRSYLEPWEAVIFAENRGGNDEALWAEICEPMRAWFCAERDRLNLTNKAVNQALGTATSGSGMAGHYFKPPGAVQWELPTEDHYNKLKLLGFSSEYKELELQHSFLLERFEASRRSFTVTAATPHTDLWAFDPVRPYPGKHPCEKPQAMLEHIITASSRPGAVVFDAFAGTGSTGMAALKLGRQFIGCEMASHHHADALRRISGVQEAANDNSAMQAAM